MITTLNTMIIKQYLNGRYGTKYLATNRLSNYESVFDFKNKNILIKYKGVPVVEINLKGLIYKYIDNDVLTENRKLDLINTIEMTLEHIHNLGNEKFCYTPDND